MNDILLKILQAIERFEKDTGRKPSEVIVSNEVFVKIRPVLKDIVVDKDYSKGFLGSIVVRAYL